ncbi:hypothetical protein B0H12DRAFT_361021 [Mycena haematopus]|nr:hypothetical protein B0H12DRAFT_361021 [Mycena haematopus]
MHYTMPRFSASLLLAVLATSFLTANAAPLQFSAVAARANDNNADFQTACDNGAVAGQLVGTALTQLGSIQTNDQNVASQLATMKAILDATNTAGGQVAAACQAGGISANANNNNNNQNQNQNANSQNQQANNNVRGLGALLNILTIAGDSAKIGSEGNGGASQQQCDTPLLYPCISIDVLSRPRTLAFPPLTRPRRQRATRMPTTTTRIRTSRLITMFKRLRLTI